ncbi:hypothetical protein [Sphingomonas sp. 3-13AW]|uniref:hypothetical protein n=1 Tax=Sphingomonas sp. 3-13AW TaxID=3050450 RepID=UPI003BB5F6B4
METVLILVYVVAALLMAFLCAGAWYLWFCAISSEGRLGADRDAARRHKLP